MSAADHVVSLVAVLAAVGSLAAAWWRKAPVVLGLLLGNILVFALGVATGRGFLSIAGSPLLDDLAARVSYFSAEDWPRLYTILTATYLHANASHIFGNMLVLFLVGTPFEERVGRGRFLLIYFWSAIVAVLLHALYIHETGTALDRTVPLVGASGAVFGILGAFATMYPRDRVLMPIILILRVPVFLGAIIFTFIEFLALAAGQASGVAHAAHLGGAVGGVILGLLLRQGPLAHETKPGARRKIDYAVLERLATTPQQRGWIQKVRENEDHPETQHAWLERLLPTLTCPQHGLAYEPKGRNRLACPAGHEERYAD
jgi:rhomboid family protein